MCVGWPEETRAALYLVHKAKSHAGTPVMEMFEKEVLSTIKDPEELVKECLTPINEHAIPEEYQRALS
jgi:hypothetical protein